MDWDKALEVISFIEANHISYYAHGGFGMRLHGFDTGTDDLDIRVSDEKNTDSLFGKYKKNAYFREDKKYSKGIYGSRCLCIFDSVDVIADVHPQTDVGLVNVPFDEKPVQIVCPAIKRKLPVASLESILLYYLVMRRGPEDKKKDLQRIAELLSSGKINFVYLKELIKKTGKENELLKILEKFAAVAGVSA